MLHLSPARLFAVEEVDRERINVESSYWLHSLCIVSETRDILSKVKGQKIIASPLERVKLLLRQTLTHTDDFLHWPRYKYKYNSVDFLRRRQKYAYDSTHARDCTALPVCRRQPMTSLITCQHSAHDVTKFSTSAVNQVRAAPRCNVHVF